MSTPKNAAGWVCQTRDIEILHELVQSRVVTIQHIAKLYFDGRQGAAYKRLAILQRAGLITTQQERTNTASSLVYLTQHGYQLLRSNGQHLSPWTFVKRRQEIRPAILRHELDVTTVKIAMTLASRVEDAVSLDTFTTSGSMLERMCGHRNIYHERLRPDAYASIIFNGIPRHFFLELDRSNQSTHIIQNKATSYRHLYRSGAFAKAFGVSPDQPQRAPFRVLVVCRTVARRNSLAASMLAIIPPVRTQCIFATLDDVTPDALGEIWLSPHALAQARAAGSDTPQLASLFPERNGQQK